jgi:hypothetical protein
MDSCSSVYVRAGPLPPEHANQSRGRTHVLLPAIPRCKRRRAWPGTPGPAVARWPRAPGGRGPLAGREHPVAAGISVFKQACPAPGLPARHPACPGIGLPPGHGTFVSDRKQLSARPNKITFHGRRPAPLVEKIFGSNRWRAPKCRTPAIAWNHISRVGRTSGQTSSDTRREVTGACVTRRTSQRPWRKPWQCSTAPWTT